jgi:uncharacterized lipoprotein YajG
VIKLLTAVAALLILAGCATPQPIQEDDPRWDCRVHGNEICGKE